MSKVKIEIEEKVLGYRNTYEKIVSHIKKNPDTTVKAAMTRMSNIFDQNEYVYSTLSGGKDSGLVTYMCMSIILMRRDVLSGKMSIEEYNEILGTQSTVDLMKRNLRTGLMTMDPEMVYSYTAEFYERTYKTLCGKYEIGDLSWVDKENKENNPGCYSYEEIKAMSTEEIQELITGYGEEPLMDGYWMTFPIAWENMTSLKEARYWSYDPEKKDVWTRPLPEGNYVWNLENFTEFPLRYNLPPMVDDTVIPGLTDQELRVKFSKWIKTTAYKGKRCAVLVAIRAAESFDRYTILKQGDYTTGYYGSQFGVSTYSPVIDMTNEDVYRFYSVFDLPINKAYDKMYDAGIPLAKMRIGSLFNSHAGSSASWLASLDPGTHAKVLTRVDGANFNNAYGGRVASSKHISIPQHKPFNEGYPTRAQELAIELLNIPYKQI